VVKFVYFGTAELDQNYIHYDKSTSDSTIQFRTFFLSLIQKVYKIIIYDYNYTNCSISA